MLNKKQVNNETDPPASAHTWTGPHFLCCLRLRITLSLSRRGFCWKGSGQLCVALFGGSKTVFI